MFKTLNSSTFLPLNYKLNLCLHNKLYRFGLCNGTYFDLRKKSLKMINNLVVSRNIVNMANSRIPSRWRRIGFCWLNSADRILLNWMCFFLFLAVNWTIVCLNGFLYFPKNTSGKWTFTLSTGIGIRLNDSIFCV